MRELALIWILAAHPAAAGELSRVMDAALARSPALEATRARTRQAEAALSESKASRLPKLSARTSLVRGDDPVYVFGSLLQQRSFGPQNFDIGSLNQPGYLTNVKSSLELGVPIFTAFGTKTRLDLGRLGVDEARLGTDAAGTELRARSLETYLRVLLDQQTLGALDERLGSAARELEEARRLKERGVVLGSDFYAAQAILGGLLAWRTQVQGDLEAQKAGLAVLTGREEALSATLMDSPYKVSSASEVVREALERRLELRQAELAGSAAKVLSRQASASILPVVEAFAALETDTRDFSSNPTSRMFGLRAAFPFGDPAYPARRAQAAAEVDAARASKQALEDEVREQVARSRALYGGAEAALPGLKDTAERAHRSLELFRPLYREGRQSVLEVLRAEEGLARAQAAYLETMFRLHAGYGRLMAAAGALDETAAAAIESRLGAAP